MRLRERDADLEALNRARTEDLLAILKQLDFEPRSSNRLPESTPIKRGQSLSRD
jgi:hypothetical protein